jgi:hypothetical protein
MLPVGFEPTIAVGELPYTQQYKTLFEDRVLGSVFGPKRDEVTGEWGRLHNEELNDLYSLPQYSAGGKIEKNVMGVACC